MPGLASAKPLALQTCGFTTCGTRTRAFWSPPDSVCRRLARCWATPRRERRLGTHICSMIRYDRRSNVSARSSHREMLPRSCRCPVVRGPETVSSKNIFRLIVQVFNTYLVYARVNYLPFSMFDKMAYVVRLFGTIDSRCTQCPRTSLKIFWSWSRSRPPSKSTRARCHTKHGKALLIHVPTYRDWLMNRMTNQKTRARKRAWGREG